MGLFIFLAFAVIISIVITIFLNKMDEKKHTSYISEHIQPIPDINFESDDEYKKAVLKQMHSINMNLVELQFEIKKQKEHLNNIQFNTSLLAVIVFLIIFIRIILIIAGVHTVNEML